MEIWQFEEAAVLAPIVLALVEASKLAGLPAKVAPIASVALGIVLFWSAEHAVGTALPERFGAFILPGAVVGLAASGLYGGGKKLLVSDPPAAPAPKGPA